MPDDALFTFRGPLYAALAARGCVTDAVRGLAIGLPVPDAADRLMWGSDAGAAHPATRARIVAEADRERASPWPQPTASLAARVRIDGDRDRWEQLAFGRQHRLSRAAVAAATVPAPERVDAVVDGALMLCEQTSWCWPAHDDVFAVRGEVLADPDAPFVDLGAGEAVAQLAWLDQLLGTALDARAPGVRRRIRREARIRIFEPFLSRRDWHWIGLDGDVHNWNPWIHGNVLAAALRLLDGPHDAEIRTRVIALCLEGIDRYAAALPLDGAVDEGYAYWWNGACRAMEALTLLADVGGARFAVLGEVPSLAAAASFPHRSHLGGAWFVNHADGPARHDPDQPWQALHAAASAVGDDDAVAFARAHRGGPDTAVGSAHHGLGRLLRALTDADWTATDASVAPLPATSWHASTQVLLARQTAGEIAGLTVAAKGGHNGEHHNHNDVGSFLVASDGVPVIVDAGRPTYTAQTFSDRRYELWMMQSSWHNVPEPGGIAQGVGAEFAASEVEPVLDGPVAGLRLELGAAYPGSAISWRRRISLDRDTARVEIADAWHGIAARPGAPTRLHLLLAGAVDMDDDGVRIQPVEPGARAVVVRWSPGITATMTVRDLDDPMLSEVWGERLVRLELDVSDRTEALVTVEQEATIGRSRR